MYFNIPWWSILTFRFYFESYKEKKKILAQKNPSPFTWLRYLIQINFSNPNSKLALPMRQGDGQGPPDQTWLWLRKKAFYYHTFLVGLFAPRKTGLHHRGDFDKGRGLGGSRNIWIYANDCLKQFLVPLSTKLSPTAETRLKPISFPLLKIFTFTF